MKIDVNKNDGNLDIRIEGRLDTTTAPELENVFVANMDGVNTLTIDCENLAYISSAGLRVLLTMHKRMKGAMKLKNVCELVMEVFEITGFDSILSIE